MISATVSHLHSRNTRVFARFPQRESPNYSSQQKCWLAIHTRESLRSSSATERVFISFACQRPPIWSLSSLSYIFPPLSNSGPISGPPVFFSAGGASQPRTPQYDPVSLRGPCRLFLRLFLSPCLFPSPFLKPSPDYSPATGVLHYQLTLAVTND